MAKYILAIDQGTTSSRAIVFDAAGLPVATAQKEFAQHYPADGWVEHDAEEIWRDVQSLMREAVAKAGLRGSDIAGIGITNQRETTVVWERDGGRPIHRAIVWQDRRTADICRQKIADGVGSLVQKKTGLLIDSYFSATKIAWLLDHVPGARARAEKGELCFGTIDSFLLFRLTGGPGKTGIHATDATNASRTMLFDITRQDWDEVLLKIFDVPPAMLPRVLDCSGEFGIASADILGHAIPVTGIAGDQQAAVFGQACFQPGMVKSTYGTGCFALVNIGPQPVLSTHRLLTTVAYRLNGKPTYALEGSIFVAGAAVKWLRDGLKIVGGAAETATLAAGVPENHGVYLVPAFVGLGAPYWDPDARGALIGLTLDTGRAHIARAALEAVAYQTRDLTAAMKADGAEKPTAIRVDGGMVANDWLCQFLADMLDVAVERPKVIETTALGAAYLAGLAVGLYAGLDAVAYGWHCERRFEPRMNAETRARLYAGWQKAVRRVLTRD
ncbi:MAG: glycerol kinase GlpK [Ferrovibrio sp.]|uniref:glycerol kinase GlpK n=1 Tax=Ferrovibrio sp. TaxID=1917215 RepID=UPI0026026C91|nr:glycerol kinase GlpK [Ferrovibrio sp.]MCW0234848.1 glycerol kinase GlpK [Ferrovibrio sp.]